MVFLFKFHLNYDDYWVWTQFVFRYAKTMKKFNQNYDNIND